MKKDVCIAIDRMMNEKKRKNIPSPAEIYVTKKRKGGAGMRRMEIGKRGRIRGKNDSDGTEISNGSGEIEKKAGNRNRLDD